MDHESRMEDPCLQVSLIQVQERSLRSITGDKFDLFLDLRKSQEELNSLLLQSPEEVFDPLGSGLTFKSTSPPPKAAADEFFNLDDEKNDHSWLLTPPGTPIFPCLESESTKQIVMSLAETPSVCGPTNNSMLPNGRAEPVSKATMFPRPKSTPSSAVRRPYSSVVPVSSKSSRSVTPTNRYTLPATSKPSRSSTSATQTSLPSSKPSSLTKPTASLATSKAPARSSTPISRPAVTKSASRSSTGTRKLATSSTATTASSPSVQSSSGSKMATAQNNVASFRGTSPIGGSRVAKPFNTIDLSVNALPKLRPIRSVSASRGRPGATSSRSSSIEPISNGRPRRLSCSSSRVHVPKGVVGPSSFSSAPRLLVNSNDGPSPNVIGSKMVERIINMRKLAPPNLDDRRTPSNNPAGKSSMTSEGSGFGRTLSKISLDMALRHMDIQSVPGNLRPQMTNASASPVYNTRRVLQNRTPSDSSFVTNINHSLMHFSPYFSFCCRCVGNGFLCDHRH